MDMIETEGTREEIVSEEVARARAKYQRMQKVLGRMMETLGLLEQTGGIETYEDEDAVREGIEVLARMLEEWQERRLMWKIRQMLRNVTHFPHARLTLFGEYRGGEEARQERGGEGVSGGWSSRTGVCRGAAGSPGHRGRGVPRDRARQLLGCAG